jgi:hypothetical protein
MMYLGRFQKAPQGRDAMHEHGPDEIPGPVRGSAAWWQGMSPPPEPTADAGPAPPPQRRRSTKEAKPIRTELVERVRKEIAAGTYDTDEKWEAALECLLGRLDTDD